MPSRRRKTTQVGGRRARRGYAPVTQLSHSRVTTWEACPRRLRYKVLDKLPDPPGRAMLRGRDVHDMAQAHAEKRGPLSQEFAGWASRFRTLRKAAQLFCEEQWGFDAAWGRMDYFGDDRLRWRVKLDALVVRGTAARAIDYKTGQVRDSHDDQLDLYALAVFARFPDVATITGELWYLDQGEVGELRYQRDEDEARLREAWDRRAEPILADSTFAPRPGAACRFCAFSKKKKNGPCEAG